MSQEVEPQLTVEEWMARLEPDDWMSGTETDVVGMALELHSCHTGASDAYISMGLNYLPRMLAHVRMRLDHWTPNHWPFDAAVEAMFRAVVAEAKGEAKWLYEVKG